MYTGMPNGWKRVLVNKVVTTATTFADWLRKSCFISGKLDIWVQVLSQFPHVQHEDLSDITCSSLHLAEEPGGSRQLRTSVTLCENPWGHEPNPGLSLPHMMAPSNSYRAVHSDSLPLAQCNWALPHAIAAPGAGKGACLICPRLVIRVHPALYIFQNSCARQGILIVWLLNQSTLACYEVKTQARYWISKWDHIGSLGIC